MKNSQPVTAFSPMQKRLHWIVVALLVLQYFVFDGMGRPFRQLMETGPSYSLTVIAHIAIGLTVLVLALWRLELRLMVGAPQPPETEPELARLASKVVHGGIYLLLIALPLSGMVAWFFRIGGAGEAHEIGTNILMALVAVHVGAALVHHFWWRTDVLKRMI